MTPKQSGKSLVMFCDEINLPDEDKFGTQTAIAFLRQLVHLNGFWQKETNLWVSLEGI